MLVWDAYTTNKVCICTNFSENMDSLICEMPYYGSLLSIYLCPVWTFNSKITGHRK